MLLLAAGGDAALYDERTEELERMMAGVRFELPIEMPEVPKVPPYDLSVTAQALSPERLRLAFASDELLEEEIRKVRSALDLRDEGALLLARGEFDEAADRLTEALAAYNESLSWFENEGLRRKISDVERLIQERLEAASPERALASALWSEGKALEEGGRPYEALGKFRESLKTYSPDDLRAYADDLEGRLKERALALVREGIALQRDAERLRALEKFRESREYYPLKEVEDHIAKLERFLKQYEPTNERPSEELPAGGPFFPGMPKEGDVK